MNTPAPTCRKVVSILVALTWLSSATAAAGALLTELSPRPLEEVAAWTAPPVNVEHLLREDEEARPGTALRVGFPMKTDLTPADSGSWDALVGGDRLWRLKLSSSGALWTVVGLETFRLAPGARLSAYDPARTRVLGPFTADHVRRHGQLWLPPIAGGTVVLELQWPRALADRAPELRVGTVSHGYKAWTGLSESESPIRDPIAGAAGACNVDVNCPAGDDWQDEKRGVVQLLSGGSAFCTGSLVNTTAGDCRPYVLTAAHCQAGPSTTFLFQYERAGCESGETSIDRSVTGATVLANDTASDFTLLELDQLPPPEFDAYYNGWQRSTTKPQQTWTIHHPSGDTKKISHNQDLLLHGQYWGPSHWLVEDWEVGSTEGGSSGAPLFDAEGRILGQLHGGTASCASDGWDEFGKLAVAWTGGGTAATRLRDWLDPLASEPSELPGLDAAVCAAAGVELAYGGYDVDDAAGNDNGTVDPGETVDLRLQLTNQGTQSAIAVAGSLAATSPLIAVSTSERSWPTIDVGASAWSDPPAFTLEVPADWPCGEPIGLLLHGVGEPQLFDVLPFEVPTGQEQIAALFVESVEGTLEDWNLDTAAGIAHWEPSERRSFSATRSWFVPDPPAVTDARLVLTLGSLAEGSHLRFDHYMDSEAGRDGGVLEYTTDGVAWHDAGPLLVDGGYDGSLDLSRDSALSGRAAWTGSPGGWRRVTADLTSLGSAVVSLRWRFASDGSIGDEGWYVDDIVVEERTTVCDAVAPALPGEASPPHGPAAPLRLAATEAGTTLTWSAPTDGGPIDDYVLYRLPLGALAAEAICAGSLGGETHAVVAGIADDSAFVVVARNASGSGPLGQDSSGTPRPAPAPASCP